MKVAFIYYKFYDRESNRIHVGGAENYIYRLTQICAELGHEPIVFQIASTQFEAKHEHIKVVGVEPSMKRSNFHNRSLYKAALRRLDVSKDLVIFAADLCSVRTDNPRCISINHGVFWDFPAAMAGGPYKHKIGGVFGQIYKEYIKLRMRRLFDNCNNRVCVDYNFLNWYRTATNDVCSKRITVIPNFTEVADEKQATEPLTAATIKVLFARRFSVYRGTRIMAQAAKNILARHQNVEFTLAGDGPDEEYLHKLFGNDPRVTFTKFEINDSLRVNLDHHICVIPSLASEGTSLSVAEAMGAGRAVIASNVGGITNMIIDGYNGLLINPDADQLTAALDRLIQDSDLRQALGRAAYGTASKAFSYERWRQAWVKLLQEMTR